MRSNGGEDAGWQGWASWSQVLRVGEGGISNTGGRSGLWIRETLPPLRLERGIIAGDCGLVFGIVVKFH